MISFNLQLISFSPKNVEDIENNLEGNSNAIVPVGAYLTDEEFNVVAFQPNCKQRL